MQDERNRLYGETNPVGSVAADVTGAGMLAGPAFPHGTRLSHDGHGGVSLGTKVLQGAGGMGAIETANQLLRGNDPRDQGFTGPVPLAAGLVRQGRCWVRPSRLAATSCWR
jgi:hypothetical protein